MSEYQTTPTNIPTTRPWSSINKQSNNAEILRQISYVSKLLFPNYSPVYFPVFCFLQLLAKFKREMKPSTIRFTLKPIPNKLFDILIEDEVIKSENVIFVTENTFENFVDDEDFSWMSLSLPGAGISNGDNNNQLLPIISNGGTAAVLHHKSHESYLVKVMPWKKCELNTVFVKENFYHNFRENFEIAGDDQRSVYVSLNELPNSLTFPRIATKASVTLLNIPFDVTTDLTDIILSKYFESPRLVHRNYIYEISIDDTLMGSYHYSRNFHIFSLLKKVNFRINNLESKVNDFEYSAVIAKNFTSLHQSSSVNGFTTKQCLDDYAFVPKIPAGLRRPFTDLRSCFLPFIQNTNRESSIITKNNLKDMSRHINPVFMVHGDRGSGKFTVLDAIANDLGMHVYLADCAEIVSQISAQTEAKLKVAFNRSKLCEPMIICFQNFEIFGVDHDNHEDLRLITTFQQEICELFVKERQFPIIIVALFNDKQIHPMIQRLFLEIIKIQPPTQEERLEIFNWLETRESFYEEIFNGNVLQLPLIGTNKVPIKCLIENEKLLEEMANATQGFLFGDLKLLLDNSIKYMKSISQKVLRREHLEKNLLKLQGEFADSLGAPKVPKVLWSDIGGLASLKEEIQSSIGLPLKHLHLMGKNMRRSGILLYGPPGTGKTLVAKAVATECNLSFLSVQGPELLNMYVGQSEQNVREVFDRARSAAPCVIFLDELDSLAPNRGVAGDSGGVMDRVVSQLLAEMDGMSLDSDPQKQIFILAATNRPDLIDPALLRPGRFDKLLYVGPCITATDKLLVLKAITNKFNFDEKLKLELVAEMLKHEMSGADLYSICSNAWLGAVRRTVLNKINKRDSSKVVVNFEDFKTSVAKFIPSISKKDLEYFNRLKNDYSK